MELKVPKGKYILAVSGGVDSMALLHLMVQKQNEERRTKNEEVDPINSSFSIPHSSFSLVVAHFNHGIRADSGEDEKIVVRAAEKYGLPVEVGRARLGPDASEAAAREARYNFLNFAKEKHGAKAIIIAHHQDDLIETALLNVLRGTGYKGLVAIMANRDIIRPLLGLQKRDLINYAQTNNLRWREDRTNSDVKYLRNHLRRQITQKLTVGQRAELIKNIEKVAKANNKLEYEIAKLSQLVMNGQQISRSIFAGLPHDVGSELMAYWLRNNRADDFDRRTVNRLEVALKTARADTIHPAKGKLRLRVSQSTAYFSSQ